MERALIELDRALGTSKLLVEEQARLPYASDDSLSEPCLPDAVVLASSREDITAALAKTVWGYGDGLPDDHIRQAGLDPKNPVIRQAAALAHELIGFPRHLSQHVGGFVIARGLLAYWRITGEGRCRDAAIECGRSMIRDFASGAAIHPFLSLPGKQPLPYEPRWSGSPAAIS